MRIKDVQVRRNLENAYKEYSSSSSEAEIYVALLGLHTGIENAFRSYLKAHGVPDVDYYQIKFPALMDMVRDKTDLFNDDPDVVRLLVSLNTTRVGMAHPDEEKRPPPQQIENDARQFAKLIRRFWPSFFGNNFPASLEQAHPKPVPQPPQQKPQRPQESQIQQPITQPRKVEQIRPRSDRQITRIKLFLKKIWIDEREPRLQKAKLIRRAIAVYLLFSLSAWLKSASFFTARWPQPVKYIGVALFILAGAAFLCGCIISGKILAQLRLKRLLLFASVIYIFYIAAVLLTSETNVSITQQLLITNQNLISAAREKTSDAAVALLEAPSQFRAFYSGRGNPAEVGFTDDLNPSRLTPIPANYKAEQATPIDQKNISTPSVDVETISTASPTSFTQLSDPDSAFSDASIFSIGFLENGNLLVTIQVPGGVVGDYQGIVEGETFDCAILEDYPDRLYCYGPGFVSGEQLIIRVLDRTSNEVVYETEFTVPILSPTP